MGIKKGQSIRRASTYHHGDLRGALVRAAEQLLEMHGAAGLSLREAAKLAGVSHAAPYRHFRSKSQLLEAVAKAGFERLTASIETVRDDYPGDPVKQLMAAGQSYVEWAIANPQRTRLMYGGMMKSASIPDDLYESAESAYQAIYQVMDEGRRLNIFAGDDTDTMVVSAWSLVHGLTMLLLGSSKLDPAGPDDVKELVHTICRTILYGICDRGQHDGGITVDD